MRRAKQILFVLAILFVVIQFIQPPRNRSEQVAKSDISNAYVIPDHIHTLLKNACFDCHSNNTRYPWYSLIQPVGWLIAEDIENGKARLNFNEIGSLSPRRQASKLQQVENAIKDGSMPLGIYQLMHPSARLTDEERRLLIDWIGKTRDAVSSQR